MSLSRSASALIATLLALLNGCATGTAARHDVGPVGESPLHVAAMTGRRDVVQGLLDQGAAVDMRGSGGLAGSSLRDVTPLHLAALYGHEPVIRLLLARGAHPNARASNGMTPLHAAAGKTSSEQLAAMLGKAGVAARVAEEVTQFLGGQHLAGATLLLARGGVVDAKDSRGWTPLNMAAARGHLDIATLLLDRGADPRVRDNEGFTPLHSAAEKGHAEVVRLLITWGAPVGARIPDGQTALHRAVDFGFEATVKTLLAAGAEVDARTELQDTPLHRASSGGRESIVRALIEKGAAVDARTKSGATPLHFAVGGAGPRDTARPEPAVDGPEAGSDAASVAAARLAIAQLLLNRGASVNARTDQGLTPLHLAAMGDRPDLIRLLVGRGADLGARDQEHGATPLHRAAREGRAATVDALLAAGADVEVKDRYGLTPMRQATSAGRAAVVARLLAHGVDPTRADAEGFTALHVAADRGHASVVEVLLAQGVRVRALLDARVHDGRTPLHLAAQAAFPRPTVGEASPEYLGAAELLLAKGADLSARDRLGQTPLHLAAGSGNRPVAELLLARGADPRAMTHNGQTVADYARRRNDRPMLDALASAPPRPQPADASTARSSWQEHMEAGNRAYAAGRHDDARAAWRLALDEAHGFGPGDPRRFPPLQSLGRLALAQGRHAEAEPLLRQALELRQKLLGAEDRDAAESLIELGASLYAQGKYEETERLALQANAIREKVLGPDHPQTMKGLTDLSGIYRVQARYAEAEQLLRRVLAAREKTLGPDHADVAGSLNDLAVVLLGRGQYAEAEPLLRRAIETRERILGRTHPDVAESLGNLATLYQFQRRDAEAEQLYREVLAIEEKALGSDHPWVATTLNNLGMLVRARGRYAEAEPLLQRALGIREKTLGPNHPDVAQSLNNLAVLYFDQGRATEAEPLLQRALGIQENTFGPGHPRVAQSLVNLGELYFQEGRYTEAEALLKQALTIREMTLGPDHPDLAQTLANLAGAQRVQGRHDEAETLQRRALAIRETRLGPEHPDVVKSLYALAETTLARGNVSETDALFRRASELQRARGETPAVVTLTALSHDHVDRLDPQRLAVAALDGVVRRLSALGIQDRLVDPAGKDAEATTELRRGLARAVDLAQGRTSPEDLERTAADAMVRSLQDPHTRLLSPDEARTHALQGMGRREYVGIGVVPVTRQGHHYVWHVRPDSPADQAGLKAFDRLLAVDGHTVDAFPDEEVGRRIQGPAGTIVTLTMRRRGEPQPRLVPVVRGVVPVQAVEHRVLPPGIGYVRLADFAGGTGRAMRRALEDLQSRGLDGLIVDVRNNPGGFFREVAQVAELLLPRGSMVEALETRFGRSVHVTRDDPLLSASIPLVILVNERTQSAAETFAAAVQGAGRGVLIGTRTAGDAGSKTLVWLPDGAGLLMRKARVISPRGADLDKDGVAPDVIQELTLEELDRGLDSQLLRASAAVRQK